VVVDMPRIDGCLDSSFLDAVKLQYPRLKDAASIMPAWCVAPSNSSCG
jgi:hypothetical protein